MLARYKLYRGPRAAGDPMPVGIRQDTRKHTSHCLRPSKQSVAEYISRPNNSAWRKFAADYLHTLKKRLNNDPAPFEILAQLAREHDVFIGCSCPTKNIPDVERCHTVLALSFMQEHFDIVIEFPHKGDSRCDFVGNSS